VIERDIGLRTFVESGVRLDARISRELLLSIFNPGLPLHDGAVIIQNDRISAAACFLPLTTNPVFRNELGTRHRASIGITEETDCLSLVVSEETGRISVAIAGDLKQGLEISEVEKLIQSHFGAPPRAALPEEIPPDALLESRPGAERTVDAAKDGRL